MRAIYVDPDSYRPLPRLMEKYLRIREMQMYYWRKNLFEIILRLIFVIFFLLLVIAIAGENKYNSMLEIKRVFILGETTNSLGLRKVITDDDFWTYIYSTFIKAITWSDNSTLPNNCTKVVGAVRFRMLRVCPVACIRNSYLPLDLERLLEQASCSNDFTRSRMDTKSYKYLDWSHEIKGGSNQNDSQGWKYYTSDETGNRIIYDVFGILPGSGYIIDAWFGEGMTPSKEKEFERLRSKWITHETRFIIIDFILVNAHINLYNAVKLIFHKTVTTTYSHSYKIRTGKLFWWTDEHYTLRITAYFILFAISLLWEFIIIFRYIWEKRKCFCHFNPAKHGTKVTVRIDIINPICALFANCIWLLLLKLRNEESQNLTNEWNENFKKYPKIDKLCLLDELFNYISACVTIMRMLQCLYLFRNTHSLRVIKYVTLQAFAGFISMLGKFFIFSLSFSYFLSIIYLPNPQVGKIIMSSVVPFLMFPFGLLHKFNFKLLTHESLFASELAIILTGFVYFTMFFARVFCTILMNAHRHAIEMLHLDVCCVTLWDYINERILYNQGDSEAYRRCGLMFYRKGKLCKYMYRKRSQFIRLKHDVS